MGPFLWNKNILNPETKSIRDHWKSEMAIIRTATWRYITTVIMHTLTWIKPWLNNERIPVFSFSFSFAEETKKMRKTSSRQMIAKLSGHNNEMKKKKRNEKFVAYGCKGEWLFSYIVSWCFHSGCMQFFLDSLWI